ncbi:hypothetical protein MN116_006268 [Schistosoma mekongi]|uniref:Uncharacterized protein n=1 Tax=Schistosoma mekongi TaxID=38744 RepID=A0AAE1ZBN8_SCHME|nr:hypothetical protein MN116_006268 [Schistosoma mekongi]
MAILSYHPGHFLCNLCGIESTGSGKILADKMAYISERFDPQDRKIVKYWADDKLVYAFKKSEDGENDDTVRHKDVRSKQVKKDKPLVKLLPLVEAIRAKRYTLLQEIFIWDCYIENDDMIALTGLFDKGCYLITRVELINCFLDVKSISLLVANISQFKTLRELRLDFNDIGEHGCHILCKGLAKSQCLVYLSLCFCSLNKQCGLWLGNVIAETAVRELILDGNSLEAEGTIALLSRISDAANQEGFERTEGIRKKQLLSKGTKNQGRIKSNNLTSVEEEHDNNVDLELTLPSTPTPLSSIKSSAKSSKKKSSKGKKRSRKHKSKSSFPSSGPQIAVLKLADNEINHYGQDGNFTSVRCMQLMKSKDLREIDLFGNDIGDLAARQILEGILFRKDAKLPQISVRLDHRINQDTFDMVRKLASGLKKPKRRSKKKSKK